RTCLGSQWAQVGDALAALPSAALPAGEAVVGLTLHPSYLAKSYYPAHLLKDLQLRHMGSRAVHLRPEKITSKRANDDPRPLLAPLIYVAGAAERIEQFSAGLDQWTPLSEYVRDDFRKIEEVALPKADRFKPLAPALAARKDPIPLEIVLHDDDEEDGIILPAFTAFCQSLGVKLILERRRRTGGLVFLPARALVDDIPGLLDFTFLRAVRGMPVLKPLDPILRSQIGGFKVALPQEDAIVPDLAVAIFDGGLPEKHGLERWVTAHDAPGVGAPIDGGPRHGIGVTSAFLFGPLAEGETPPRPFANVEHWRVIGDDTKADDFALLAVLERIENVISSQRYDFINISLGPDSAIEDDDVNSWTSTIDALLADGETVATVACGNNGEADTLTGLHRIQPPSDGVNIISVGAANKPFGAWTRAPYSACGPGRSPGFVKPDLIAFGGSAGAPFLMLDGSSPGGASGNCGTSFASPLVMRCAAGVRAQFAQHLWAPTVKALMIHQADPAQHARPEVGWGRLSHGLGDLVLCEDGEAHIVYQRLMPTSGSVRMELPVPPELTGMFEFKATFCIYAEIDPEDSLNYTRAGLDIQFRPDSVTVPPPYRKDGKLITPTVPSSTGFFSSADLYATEFMRREDAHKWETTFTKTKKMRSTSLNRPVFDVGYAPRQHGQGATRSANLKLALVLTIRQAKTKNLYDRIVATAAGRLQPLRARAGLQVPARLRR
ncbi:MAG TPA: S8 family peptidase, partial [Caulobacter sp.]|nr:S8 family peptidase [Caulobacter sp.]